MDKRRVSPLLACTVLVALIVGAGEAIAAFPTATAVGEESTLTDLIDVPAEGTQDAADIALSDGTGMAVWSDTRKGVASVWAALVEDGGASKTVGWEIPALEGETDPPRVAASANHYLVVWEELTGDGAEVVAALLDGAGRVVRARIVLGPSGRSGEVAVAGLSGGFAVAYVDEAGSLVARTVTRAGRVGRARIVYDESTRIEGFHLAAGSEGYLLTFVACDEDCRFGARAARLTGAGDVLDPDGLPLMKEPPSFEIRSAWNGSTWVAVWESNGRLHATHVAYDERPGARPATPILPAGGYRFDLAWTGSNYVLAMADLSRVTTSMLVPDPLIATPPVAIADGSDNASSVALDASAGEIVLLWDAKNGSYRDVFQASLLSTGIRDSDPTVLVQSAYGQIHPSLTSGVGGSLALWQDYRDHEGPIIYGARIEPTGRTLDPQGFPISEQNGRHPVAAWNGEAWLVVWKGNVGMAGLVGKRVAADGRVLDPAPIPIAVGPSRASSFDIASNGDSWVVLYRDPGKASLDSVHISSLGIPSTPVSIENHAVSPSIAWHGDRYVSVWERRGNIRGVFLSESGEPLDAARRITDDNLDSQPSVASDGLSALITWGRCFSSCERAGIHGLVIASSFDDGRVAQLSSATGNDAAPISFHDGTGFGFVFKRCLRECLRPAGYVRYVTGAGSIDGPEVYLATAHLRGAPAFSLATSADGAVTITYRKVEGPASAAGVPRAYKVSARRI